MGSLILSEIWIYPIKSLGGIPLSSAKVMEKGLQYDRRWMLVDHEGVFLTQRVLPKMALLKQKIDGDQLTIRLNDPASDKHPEISFDMTLAPTGKPITAKIFDDTVQVVEVAESLSLWFSQQLGLICRLVVFPENHLRPVDEKYQVNHEHVGLADAYPFLIIGQSSLDTLNHKLKDSIPMNRFRPNFVFTGGEPNEEDNWRNFKIGENRFVGVKPCARCAVPTINQVTGEKGIEPTATLATYRKKDAKVFFGENLVALDHNTVHVGDTIEIFDLKSKI